MIKKLTPTLLLSLVVSLIYAHEYNNEKIFVHFDKTDYSIGEYIWFNAFLINEHTNDVSERSKVVYIDLIDPDNKILQSKTLKVDKGSANGEFWLPIDLKEGSYKVRAYTNIMRNYGSNHFFWKSIWIHSLNEDTSISEEPGEGSGERNNVEVQFFPEGGQLNQGLSNRVGFKVISKDGYGVVFSGSLTDDTGKELMKISTNQFGIGVFEFVPEKNKTYMVTTESLPGEKAFGLPEATSSGVNMQVHELNNYYRVYMETSDKNGLYGYSLLCNQNHGFIFSAKLKGRKSRAIIKVPKEEIHHGVLQFLILDKNEQKVNERITFFEDKKDEIRDQQNFSVNITDLKDSIKLNIRPLLTNENGENNNLSLSVTRLNSQEASMHLGSINPYLHLKSELSSPIETPDYYFNSTDPDRRQNLEYLLMTQTWHPPGAKAAEGRINNDSFKAEKGITLSGRLVPKSAKKKQDLGVRVMYSDFEKFVNDETVINENGSFSFSGLDIYDSTQVYLDPLVLEKEGKQNRVLTKSKDFEFVLDKNPEPEVKIPPTELERRYSAERLSIRPEIDYKEFLMNGPEHLNEVFVEMSMDERRKSKQKRRNLYRQPSHSIDFDSIVYIASENVITAVSRRVPGVSVVGGQVIIRGYSSMTGNNSALILVDGIPVGGDVDLPITEVDFVDVIKGPRAAIYGSRASNGIIAIYTKIGSSTRRSSFVEQMNHAYSFRSHGFSRSKEFFVPNYLIVEEEGEVESSPETIYWNPRVAMSDQGEFEQVITTYEPSEYYLVVIQGVSQDGRTVDSRIVVRAE